MRSNNKFGLYIHIPFCRSKCSYCDYYSFLNLKKIPIFLSYLEKEISLYRSIADYFDTIYVGGGTPSIIEPLKLNSLFKFLFKRLPISDSVEITFEINPEDVTRDLLQTLKNIGVTRISLGVQSFREDDLRFLNRSHDVTRIPQIIQLIRDYGFQCLNVDLIYGLPIQTLDQWITCLGKILDFHPEHLSCYQLTVEKRTKLGILKAKGELKEHTLESQSAFFTKTSEILRESGYIHYEVSNFAIDPKHFSSHNVKYWSREPYIGLGPSAHSFIPEKRWWNVKSLEKYLFLLKNKKFPIDTKEELTYEEIKIEKLFLGFRCFRGHSMKFLCSFNKGKEIVRSLQDQAFVEVSEDRVIPTEKGLLFSDYISRQFI